MSRFQLPDGRTLEYHVGGAPDGFPLIWHHGTPGSGIIPRLLQDACERKGVKIVSMTRAGYAKSTRDAGRRIVNVVADVEALTSHLGIKKCFVGGWSGGGPHTLACAARLSSCVAAMALAAVGPSDAADLDFLAGQGEDNVHEFNAANKGQKALREFTEAARKQMVGADAAGITAAMDSLLPDVDKAALASDSDIAQYMVDSFADGLACNTDGWIDDDMAFIAPWGFDVADIKVPVIVCQGTDDKMVPFAHGEWLAKHIPAAFVKAHLHQGEGHLSAVDKYLDGMLDELLSYK